MKRSDIEINEILNSFDGMSRAEARPFMYTRIMAKLQEEKTFMYRAVTFFAKPVIAVACIAAVLVVNVYTVLQSDFEHADSTNATSANTSTDASLSENYILAANDFNQY